MRAPAGRIAAGDHSARPPDSSGPFEATNSSDLRYVLGADESGSEVITDFNLTLSDLPSEADPRVDRKDVLELAAHWIQETGRTVGTLIRLWTQRDGAPGITA